MARASKQPKASGNFGVGPRVNQGQAGARRSRPRSAVQSMAGPGSGRVGGRPTASAAGPSPKVVTVARAKKARGRPTAKTPPVPRPGQYTADADD